MDTRLAKLDDADRISALMRPLAIEFIACDFPAAALDDLLAPMSGQAIRSCLLMGDRYHVAEDDGALIGVIGLQRASHVHHLFVARSHQHRGVARRLWEVARADALVTGNPGVFTVGAARHAIGWYQRLGFVPRCGFRREGGIEWLPMRLYVEATFHC